MNTILNRLLVTVVFALTACATTSNSSYEFKPWNNYELCYEHRDWFTYERIELDATVEQNILSGFISNPIQLEGYDEIEVEFLVAYKYENHGALLELHQYRILSGVKFFVLLDEKNDLVNNYYCTEYITE